MGATSMILKNSIPEEYVKDLKKVVAVSKQGKKGGFWNWIKRTVKRVPIQFIKIMLKVLKAFLRNEVRTLLLDLFKLATKLQVKIENGSITPEEAGTMLRKDAKFIAPDAMKSSNFIINFLCEISVFAVKLISG